MPAGSAIALPMPQSAHGTADLYVCSEKHSHFVGPTNIYVLKPGLVRILLLIRKLMGKEKMTFKIQI